MHCILAEFRQAPCILLGVGAGGNSGIDADAARPGLPGAYRHGLTIVVSELSYGLAIMPVQKILDSHPLIIEKRNLL